MTRFVPFALLMGVAALLWLIRGRRPTLLVSTDASAVASLNRAQISRAASEGSTDAENTTGPGGSLNGEGEVDAGNGLRPATGRERLLWLARIRRLSSGSPAERLRAVHLCARNKDASVLPQLRSALHDANSTVVLMAAKQMTRYRGRPTIVRSRSRRSLPRNVARIR